MSSVNRTERRYMYFGNFYNNLCSKLGIKKKIAERGDVFQLSGAEFFYFNKLYSLSISAFDWINLPIEIDPTVLERMLNDTGSVILYKEPVLNQFIVLLLETVTEYDIYGIPKKYDGKTLYNNIRYSDLSSENSVLIFDNVSRVPVFNTIRFYATRLANARLTLDSNIRAMKTPYIIKTNNNQLATVKALLSEIDKFNPNVIVDNMLDLGGMQALDLNIKDYTVSVRSEIDTLWNEALASIGIPNLSQVTHKAERMTKYETSKTISGAIAQQYTKLATRLIACKRFNELYNPTDELNVTYQRGIYGSPEEFNLATSGIITDSVSFIDSNGIIQNTNPYSGGQIKKGDLENE